MGGIELRAGDRVVHWVRYVRSRLESTATELAGDPIRVDSGGQPEAAWSRMGRPPATNPGLRSRGMPSFALDVAGHLERGRGRVRATWLVGAVFFVLAVLQARVLPPEAPTDATSNLGYAMVLGSGRLPTIHTPIPRVPPLEGRIERDRALGKAYRINIWTANHPPLYYAITAIPVRLGVLLDARHLGIELARFQNVVLALALLWATRRLALTLVPGRPEVGVLSMAWCSAIPMLSLLAGAFFNDILAATLSVWCLVHIVELQRGGRSSRRTWSIGITAGAAMACRISGVVILGLGLATVSVAAWSGRRCARVWAADVGRVLTPSLVLALPFYLRNVLLHGEPSGTTELLKILDRRPGEPALAIAFDSEFWLGQGLQLLGTSVRSTQLWETGVELSFPLLLAAGALLLLVPWVGLWPAYRHWRGGDDGRWSMGASGWRWATVLAVPAATIAMSVLHESRGGYAHGRYLVAGLPVVAVLAALGLSALGWWCTAVVLAAGWSWVLAVCVPGFCRAFSSTACAALGEPSTWAAGSIALASVTAGTIAWLTSSGRARPGRADQSVKCSP